MSAHGRGGGSTGTPRGNGRGSVRAGCRIEVGYRTRTSLETAIALLHSVRTSPWSRRRVMLHLSRGHVIDARGDRHESGAALLEDTIAAAIAADIVVIALEPAGPPTLPPMPPQLVAPAVQAIHEQRRVSLTRLVTPSGGFAAVDIAADRPALLARIGALVGR